MAAAAISRISPTTRLIAVQVAKMTVERPTLRAPVLPRRAATGAELTPVLCPAASVLGYAAHRSREDCPFGQHQAAAEAQSPGARPARREPQISRDDQDALPALGRDQRQQRRERGGPALPGARAADRPRR